jgi:uncharacterized SAM-binding protein YcdF (DUF218 family)
MYSEIFRTYVAGLLSPTAFVGLCFLLGTLFLWRGKLRRGRGFVTLGLVGFFLLGTAPLRYLLYSVLEADPREVSEDYKYVVVLAAKIFPNPAHPTASQLSPSLLNRLATGIALVQRNPRALLVLTGNGAGPVPEAVIMEHFARELGVPAARIIVEDKSMNTRDHPVYLRPILKDEKFVVVTSAYHMRRALRNFEANGLYGIPAPTDYMRKKGLDGEGLIVRGENFAAMDRWMTEAYSTTWNLIRMTLNL